MSNETAISYAALILTDAEVEITADKLATLTKAAGFQIDSIWFDLFSKALEGKDIKDMLFNISSGAPAAAAGGAAAAAAGGAAAEEEAEEEKEEEKEESDDDMGFGLFD